MTATVKPSAPDEVTADEPDSKPAGGLLSRMRGSSSAAAQQVGPWQYGSLLGTKAFLVLIVAGVLAGPVALAWTIATAQQSTAVASADPAQGGGEDGRSRTEVVGAATNLVSMWLSASQADADALAGMVANPPAQLTLPKRRPAPPTMVTVLDAVQTSPTDWDVLVAARGGQAGAGSAYRVAVSTSDRGASVLTVPGQVPLATGPDSSAAADLEIVASSHPAAQTVNGFARALLSNSGDLSRWLVPGSALTPVTPKVCQQIRTAVSAHTSLPAVPHNGEAATVLTDLTCRISANTGRTFQYTLSLRGRDGRWEVDSYTSAVTTPVTPAGSNPSPDPTAPARPTSPTAPTPGR